MPYESMEEMMKQRKALYQDMERVPLSELPEWLTERHVFVDGGLRGKVTEKCLADYNDLFQRCCPDGAMAEYERMKAEESGEEYVPDPDGEEKWKAAEADFFESVYALQTFDFRRAGLDYGHVEWTGLLDASRFVDGVPEYTGWFIDRTVAKGREATRQREESERKERIYREGAPKAPGERPYNPDFDIPDEFRRMASGDEDEHGGQDDGEENPPL